METRSVQAAKLGPTDPSSISSIDQLNACALRYINWSRDGSAPRQPGRLRQPTLIDDWIVFRRAADTKAPRRARTRGFRRANPRRSKRHATAPSRRSGKTHAPHHPPTRIIARVAIDRPDGQPRGITPSPRREARLRYRHSFAISWAQPGLSRAHSGMKEPAARRRHRPGYLALENLREVGRGSTARRSTLAFRPTNWASWTPGYRGKTKSCPGRRRCGAW